MITDRVRGLLAEAERVDGAPPVSDQALLAAAQGRRRVLEAFEVVSSPTEAINRDSPQATPAPVWVGSTADGTTDKSALQAVGLLGEGELDLVVHPGYRGQGIGTKMLAEMLAVQDRVAPGSELRAWAHGQNPAAENLLSREGFTPARSLYRLAMDPVRLTDAIAGARPLPDGFVATRYDPADPAQAEAWVRVNARAFASHPEQGTVTLPDFTALTGEAWFDPEDLILAFDTTLPERPLAGYSWIKSVRDESFGTETELYVLGVDPVYTGRGLGAALLGETLRRMAEHEPARITLYVDGDNEHARELYDRAGFAVDQASTQWLRRAMGGSAD